MTGIFASAPGKIVLCGEYAVLDGAPAVVTAIDRRARVAVHRIHGDLHELSAPGMVDDTLRFRREASGEYRWASGRYRLVEEVLNLVMHEPMSAVSIKLDSREFRDPASGRKFGFGSSAAVTTALVAALDALLGSERDVQRLAESAHRAYQSGKGSGVDIAASFAGGTIRFQKRHLPDNGAPLIQSLNWPMGLEYRVLWSGRPVSTARKLRQLEARQAAGRQSAAALAESAQEVSVLWQTATADAVLDGLQAYVAELQRFSADHDIGIFAAGHQGLVEPAQSRNLVYKPCGAGGGDVGVVFGTDAAALNAFCEFAERTGFTRLDVRVAAPGVSTGERKDP